jgi:adenylylsulfate kinase-like enzyme
MIYWFTGQTGSGKTVLATKLRDFLQTEKRNWRKDVFLIDFPHHSQLGEAQIISTFLGQNIFEIYIHSNRKKSKDLPKVDGYEPPTENFFDLDTTSDNSTQSFTKLIHHLKEINKL